MSNSSFSDREEQALRGYLEGRMKDHDLHQALSHVARFDVESEGWRTVDLTGSLGCSIEVDVPHVVSRLKDYLRGTIPAYELMQWAAHLTLIDAYVSPGWQDDALADEYEPMWDVLQQLSSPSTDGKITPEVVSAHLRRLETS